MARGGGHAVDAEGDDAGGDDDWELGWSFRPKEATSYTSYKSRLDLCFFGITLMIFYKTVNLTVSWSDGKFSVNRVFGGAVPCFQCKLFEVGEWKLCTASATLSQRTTSAWWVDGV